MLKKIFAALAVMIFIFSATTSTTFAKTEIKDNVITVTGYGMIPKGANPNSSFYKSFARQVAKFDAIRQIVEKVKDPVVEISETPQKKVTADDTVVVKLEVTKFYAQNIKIVDEKFSDGVYQVTITIPIFLDLPE